MTSPDGRSVSELLLDAEMTARSILRDVDVLEAAPMVRGWGEVVQAATELWGEIAHVSQNDPSPGGIVVTDPADAMMARLTRSAIAHDKGLRGRAWPTPGPADERLAQMSDDLMRAADLVARVHTRSGSVSPAVAADTRAVKARLVHVLYIGSHGTYLAINRKISGADANGNPAHRPVTGELLAALQVMSNRMGAFERTAGSYVAVTYPDDLKGQHSPSPHPDRLGMALARWDVEANRALAGTFQPAQLIQVLRTQAQISDIGRAVIHAAEQEGVLDSATSPGLRDTLDTSASQWASLAATWELLTTRDQRQGPEPLRVAALEVRAALMDLAYDRTALASPATMAARTDLPRAVESFHMAFVASADLASTVADRTTDPAQQVPARVALNADTQLRATQVGNSHFSSHSPGVDPRDLAQRRMVTLPPRVLQTVLSQTHGLVRSSSRLLDASAHLGRAPAKAPPPSPPSRGRALHERACAPAGPAVSGYGCER